MQAVVLVGGFGTRLRPLTLTTPKQMLPVVGVTMIERVIGWLAGHGVTDAVLSLGYRPDAFAEAFVDQRCAGVRLCYAVEPEPLDTAGAIACAARHAGLDGRFIAVNGDVLTDADLGALLEVHDRSGALATIGLTPVEDPSRYGVVDSDDDGLVRAFVEKPEPGTEPSNWINSGQYVLETDALAGVVAGRPTSIERVVFPQLVRDRALMSVRSHAYWIDAGTVDAYMQANFDLIDGTRAAEAGVHPEAECDPSATVDRSVVGRGARIGPGCAIRNAVVLAGASVAHGCTVTDSILGGGSRVGHGATVANRTVVGFAQEVAACSTLSAQFVPPADDWN